MTNIAFLGAGNIAQAIMSGMIDNGIDVKQIWAFDPNNSCMKWVNSQGINAAGSNDEAIGKASIIMLCVKPNMVIEILSGIREDLTNKLFISVAAGITTKMMNQHLPTNTPIVRCMPNTPVQIQTGMTALFSTQHVTNKQRTSVQEILGVVGHVVWVESETDLDSVTAVSGSGPAYFFLLMESMISAATAIGLTNELSKKLVIQTALGAAKMADSERVDPEILRKRVTSPAGTTEAAIKQFQAQGFEQIVKEAIKAAHSRSVELSNEN